jgi:CRP-like cAMP-binding protein
MRQEDRMQALRGSSLFSSCSARQLKALAKVARVVRVDVGEVLITKDSPSSDAYIITAGTAEVRKGNRTLTLGAGDVVGELGLLLDRPRNATVRATSSLECVALSRADLKAAVGASPDLGWTLLQAVAARLDG